MTSARHSRQTLDQGLHSIVAFKYANATVRLAATGFNSYDIYKLAAQLSDNTFWILVDVDNSGIPTWQNIVASTGGNVGGDLSGTLPNPSVVDLTIANEEVGSLLYYNGTNWVQLSPGVDGYVLTTHSTGNIPSWSAASGSGAGLANTAPVDVSKAAASIGVSNLAARADHKHNILTATATSIGGVNSEGSSTALARADHTHAVTDLSISGQAKGDILFFNGTNWVRLGAGASGNVLVANGVGADPSWSPPATPGPSAIAAGTQVATSGSISFINSNGITFGMSNSNQITASYTVPSTAGLLSRINISAGTTSNNLSALTFSNSNGLSFGLNGSVITGSYTVPVQSNQSAGFYAVGNTTGQSSSSTFDARSMSFSGAGIASVGYSGNNIIISVPSAVGNINVSAGTTSSNLNALTFSNSNGVSFGLNNGVITATIIPGAAAGLAAVQGGTQTQTSGTLSFANSNGISFGLSNSSVLTASYTVPNTAGLISNINVSAGTTSNNLSAVTFSNSNGLSFGLNGSVITGSYTVPSTAGHISGINVSGGTTSNNLSAIVFSNSNNVTFGLNGSTLTASISVPNQTSLSYSNLNGLSFGIAGSTLTGSYTVPNTAGLISNINISAGTTSNNLNALTFSNSNGLSFGLNGSVITGSYTVPVQSNQTDGLYAIGNTTGQSSSSTFDARTMSISAAGNISAGYSGNALVISGSQSAQTQNVVVPSAGTQTASSGTVIFSNSNGISFGMSNSSVITASYTVPNTAGLISNINVSAGTTSNNLTNFVFSNSNNISFGLNGSTITATVTTPVQTAQTVGLYALGNTTQNSSTTLDARSLSFNGLGAATVGYSNGSVQISVPVQSAQTQSNIQAIFDGVNSISTGTIRYSNSNGISFGINGQTLTASYTVPSTAGLISGVNVSAGTTSNNLSAITFSNSNGLAFGLNGSVITGSYTTPLQTNQTEGRYAVGNTVGQSSSSTFDARTMSFSGAGNISVGYSAGNLIISGSSPNGSINISGGTTSNNLTNFIFSNSNGVSFGLNGSTVTGSVAAQTAQTVGMYALGNTIGQSSSSTFDARTLSFSGAGIASVGYSGNNIIINVPAAGASVNISAGTTSGNLNAVTFSNSNGISFGLSNGVITATVTPGAAAGIAAVQGGTQTQTSGTLSFANSNGISFGLSNSSIMTASYTVPNIAGLISNINISAGTTSNNLNALTFSNSNGLSFGLNGSTITGSYTVPIQSNQTEGRYAIGNTTGQSSSSTFDARTMSFSGAGNISLGYSGNALIISGSQIAQTIQTQNVVAPSAGTQTATGGTAIFSNSNGISFGMSNSSVITASYTVPNTAGLISNINISAGTTSNNLNAITFSNSNGLSFGLNGSTITASYTVPTQTAQTVGVYAVSNTTGQSSSTTVDARSLSFQGAGVASVGYSNGSVVISVPSGIANVNVSAGTTSNNLTNFIFSNSNNVSFGLNGSTITATVTTPVQTAQTIGLYGLGNTTQNSSTTLDARSLSFNGLGIVTVGYSNGSVQISASQSPQTVQSQNIAVPSAGTQSATSGTVIFSNSNGISFGMSNSSVITASYTVPNTAGLISQINISAGTTSNNLSALTFSNSNGLSFGLNGSTITGSYTVPVQTNQSVGLFAIGNTTQNSSTTLDARSLSFNGLGAATVGYSNGSIQISVPTQTAQTQSNIQAIYDGVNSISTGTIRYSNANGVSFGINGQTITGSVAAQTNQSIGVYAVGNTTGASSSTTVDARSLSFQGAGVASVGYTNGSVVISVPSGIANVNISAGTTSNNLTNFIFSNSNNVSFGLNGSTVTASITVPAQTAQTIGLYGLGNTTQNSSTTLDARSLSFNGLGLVTVGYSNGSVQISATQAAQTVQSQNVVVPSAGTQSATSGTVIFSNSNGISFGMSNSSVITASYTVPSTAGLISQINISAGTTSNNLSALTFSNSNGLSFGLNGSTITGSYTVPTQTAQTIGVYAVSNTTGASSSTTVDARSLSFQGAGVASVGYSNGSVVISVPTGIANINVSAGTTSNNLTNFVFSNSNNISFGLAGSTVTATVNVPAQTVQTQNVVVPSAGTQSATSGTLIFSNSNGISFGMSNSSVITASYTVPNTAGLISNINVSAGTTSNNLNVITFSNSNGLSFGLNGSTITGSYTVPTLTSISFSNANNITFGLAGSTLTASASFAQTAQTIGVYAVSNTTGASSSTTIDARSLSFQGAGVASVGYTNGSVVISVPTGIANINISAGTTSNNLTNFVFSNSNNVSFGLNGSTVTASVSVTNANIAQLQWPDSPWQTNFPISNASFSLQNFNADLNITATQANFLMALTGATNSSGAMTISLGIYTMAGSTMSLASSNSRVITWTSGSLTTASSIYGGVSGTRYRTIALNNWSITAGDYVLGMWFRTTNNGSWNAFGVQGPTIVGALDANETNNYGNGFSTSSYSTAMIASVNLTNTNYVRTGGNALQQPGIVFLGTL